MYTWATFIARGKKKREKISKWKKKRKKKRPLLNFGACKITFLFFSFEANKKNLLQRQKNTTTARPRDITQSDPRQKRTL
jgi:hypothetical protein